ncbi:hypothetical protein GGX14DRAFT_654434 [Mycena pura]|uniref:Uncharacterized protein n=1 Tax=Mycena pura TaxID=153505 RepID=A0AAD6Y5G3_9AGAR|nr:hypothetical protein GGX14DRAFT_654434 [Mycena pura]
MLMADAASGGICDLDVPGFKLADDILTNGQRNTRGIYHFDQSGAYLTDVYPDLKTSFASSTLHKYTNSSALDWTRGMGTGLGIELESSWDWSRVLDLSYRTQGQRRVEAGVPGADRFSMSASFPEHARGFSGCRGTERRPDSFAKTLSRSTSELEVTRFSLGSGATRAVLGVQTAWAPPTHNCWNQRTLCSITVPHKRRSGHRTRRRASCGWGSRAPLDTRLRWFAMDVRVHLGPARAIGIEAMAIGSRLLRD